MLQRDPVAAAPLCSAGPVPWQGPRGRDAPGDSRVRYGRPGVIWPVVSVRDRLPEREPGFVDRPETARAREQTHLAVQARDVAAAPAQHVATPSLAGQPAELGEKGRIIRLTV